MAISPPQVDSQREIERLVFFSDAVFAIALTLLAIDLRLPETAVIVDTASFVDALGAVAPRFYSFALSFFVITLVWVGHFRTFRVVKEMNGRIVFVNVLLLFCVVLLPFPTSVLGQHGTIPAVVAFYGLCVAMTGAVSTGLWVVVARVRRNVSYMTPRLVRLITLRAAFVPAVVLLTTPLAFVDPRIPLFLWIFVWPAQLVFERLFRLRFGPATRMPAEAAPEEGDPAAPGGPA
jgi:uncharacterized membrane protein